MNDTVTTLDQMHDQIVQIITMLDAIPPDQRTDAQEKLLNDLISAIDEYDNRDEGDAE